MKLKKRVFVSVRKLLFFLFRLDVPVLCTIDNFLLNLGFIFRGDKEMAECSNLCNRWNNQDFAEQHEHFCSSMLEQILYTTPCYLVPLVIQFWHVRKFYLFIIYIYIHIIFSLIARLLSCRLWNQGMVETRDSVIGKRSCVLFIIIFL